MADSEKAKLRLEIGHVLFIDIVGYSKLRINEQSAQIQKLRDIVRGTEQVSAAEAEGKLLRLPTGDGGALVFRNSPEAPVLCALEIATALKSHPELRVRMGIHSGPVNEVTDLNEQANIAGAGINIAQRIMDCGDAGHILVSKHAAEDLEQYDEWQPHLHALGECEVKHGERLHVVNLYTDEVGNRAVPERFVRPIGTEPAWPRLSRRGYAIGAMAVAALVIAGGLLALKLIGPRAYPQVEGAAPATPDSASPVEDSPQRAQTGRAGARPSIPDKSIAVLPFDNLSSDKENAYFAEGIQDEILTRLAKIAALKVISRTSTQKYKSAPDNLREVGKQLGVANLLEGSVQKVSNAVHVNVQLIRVATDEHLWAESYNRKLDDVFGVEGEVAGAIADQLNAKLSGSEKQELAARPTNNAEAYDAYLHGLAFFERPDILATDFKSAVQSFETAVRLDPNFALAWARLSHAQTYIYWGDDASPARRAAAQEALQKALQLQPDLVETQLAEAYFHYLTERDYDRARRIFEQVRLKEPNDSQAPLALGLIARRQGRWDESLRLSHDAIELDPRNLRSLMWISDTYAALRQFPAALKFIDRALDLAPTDNAALARKANIYQAMGQLEDADAVLARIRIDANEVESFGPILNQLVLQHRYPAAIALLQSSLAKLSAAQTFDRAQSLFGLGELQRFAGDALKAKASYSHSRELVEAALRSQPDNAEYVSALALIDAGLGEKGAAVREADRATELLPVSKDALRGPEYESNRAMVLARFGEKDAAIAILQHLLTVPYERAITPALLRLDPNWDNLRGDPRFQKLCQD
jgi:TolB-like protein/class 3 adenylate cyclase/Tfp pilus assembly protein PilF